MERKDVIVVGEKVMGKRRTKRCECETERVEEMGMSYREGRRWKRGGGGEKERLFIVEGRTEAVKRLLLLMLLLMLFLLLLLSWC